MSSNPSSPTGSEFWSKRTLTADKHLSLVLGAATNLPLKYWQPHFYFTGAEDEKLAGITEGRFPATPIPKKTHPVFALKPLPDGAGCTVCPCSSRRPFDQAIYHFIRKGCRFLHTGFETDRNSYLVEQVRFNLPASVANRLHFRGEVPVECIIPEKRFVRKVK
ncbi:MAG: hypothetical protein ACLFQY_17540 [Desulfococcaceae bacterium]